MNKNKMRKQIIAMLIVVVVIMGIFFLNGIFSRKIILSYDENVDIGDPVKFEVKIKDGQLLRNDSGSVRIELQHKYDKDEEIDVELEPFDEGSYVLLYYPTIPGEYLGNLVVEDEEVVINEPITIFAS